MSILNLDAKYLPDIDGQLRMISGLIDQHREVIAGAKLNQASLREMIPLASEKHFLTEQGVKTSTKEQMQLQLDEATDTIKFRKAALDRLLPEHDRLKELVAKRNAEKAAAEARAEEERRRAEEAEQSSDSVTQSDKEDEADATA